MLVDSTATYTPGISERRSGTTKFYHGDNLGSTRGITNTSQTATDGILYDAFGLVVSRTGNTPTPFGFVGREQYQTDADSGLLLLGHRYYDPYTGRFISQDPIADGVNWYAYVANNPLSGIDPQGLLRARPPSGGSGPTTRLIDRIVADLLLEQYIKRLAFEIGVNKLLRSLFRLEWPAQGQVRRCLHSSEEVHTSLGTGELVNNADWSNE